MALQEKGAPQSCRGFDSAVPLFCAESSWGLFVLIFAYLAPVLVLMIAGALGGLLFGAFLTTLLRSWAPEPERFVRPCLLVGASLGALCALVLCIAQLIHLR